MQLSEIQTSPDFGPSLYVFAFFFVSEPKKDVFAKHSHPVQAPQANKDDAYALFMKEMEQMMK